MDEICVADYDQKPHVVIYMRQAEGKVPGNPLVVPSCPWPNESLLRHAGVPPLGGGGGLCSNFSPFYRVHLSPQEECMFHSVCSPPCQRFTTRRLISSH